MFTLPIKKYRNMKHLTLEQLSELSGISKSQISRLEADNIVRCSTTTLATLEAIAISLKVCPHDLILYDCKQCVLNQNNECPKIKVDINNIVEENLSFYI